MTWMVIRASGFVAYLCLAGAAIWGLVVSTKLLGRSASPKTLIYVHESLSVSALLATAIHLGFLYLDEFVEFGPADIFVPGASAWRPRAVSLGIVAFYGLIVVTASFYVRKWIGQAAWRYLHYASFGVFISGLTHGVLAGTDTATPVGLAIYFGTAALILGLVVVRVVTVKQPERRPRPAPKPAPTAPHG